MSGTRVTCEDIATGEFESRTIENDYVLVTDGTCYEASIQAYRNGTHVITIKGRGR